MGKNHASGEEKILFLNSEQEKDKTLYTDQETGVEMELEENMPLLEWLANNYKKFGAGLEIITDRRKEASMCEDSAVLAACCATQLTFSRCNATTWTMLIMTWTTIKLSRSSLQLKIFHQNLLLGSTYLY